LIVVNSNTFLTLASAGTPIGDYLDCESVSSCFDLKSVSPIGFSFADNQLHLSLARPFSLYLFIRRGRGFIVPAQLVCSQQRQPKTACGHSSPRSLQRKRTRLIGKASGVEPEIERDWSYGLTDEITNPIGLHVLSACIFLSVLSSLEPLEALLANHEVPVRLRRC
jgi:hypothetical protein